jgi:hypothetical protein
MHTKKITKDEATVWFSQDELGFMIAATERALKELNPQDFHTRTGRTVDYANAVLAQLRVANGGKELRIPSQQPNVRARRVAFDPRAPTSQHVIMRVERIAEGKALLSLSDHELRFLNNAINEAVHGLHGIEEFERAIGKTREYGDTLMDELVDANDRVEALN